MIKERKIDLDNLREGITHQPKGGMCGTCINRFRDCSYLIFSRMKKIGKYSDGTIVVKCTAWEKTEIVGQVSC